MCESDNGDQIMNVFFFLYLCTFSAVGMCSLPTEGKQTCENIKYIYVSNQKLLCIIVCIIFVCSFAGFAAFPPHLQASSPPGDLLS